MNNIKFDWDDILIQPSSVSNITSRSEIKIDKLPLFTSPMDTVVDENNARTYLDMGYTVCLPRGILYNEELKECFFSYGLYEIEELINTGSVEADNVLIDIANGNMQKLFNIAEKFKKAYPNKILMAGNVANPDTYKRLSELGVDYIRCGVGNGNGCLTSQNIGIGYAMGSLIEECAELKREYNLKSHIIADGGFKKYADVIKALAVGSSYVMLGSMLNKCLESCGDNYIIEYNPNDSIPIKRYKEIGIEEATYKFIKGKEIYKKFRGMSTKEVQNKWGKKKLTTSEGVVKYNKVEYTLDGWTENFTDYLKSTMSYCNCLTLNDFIGKVQYNQITQNAFNRFNK
jgi:GMP reductase